MGIFIEGLELPKNEDGTFAHLHGDIQIAYVMTVFAYDDGRIEVQPWNASQSEYRFKETYRAFEVNEEMKL